jgi:hypothetical protein
MIKPLIILWTRSCSLPHLRQGSRLTTSTPTLGMGSCRHTAQTPLPRLVHSSQKISTKIHISIRCLISFYAHIPLSLLQTIQLANLVEQRQMIMNPNQSSGSTEPLKSPTTEHGTECKVALGQEGPSRAMDIPHI